MEPRQKELISQWDLPPLIQGWFAKQSITSLFPWQVECLEKKDVLYGGNLVYSAPTSAGKTLVADFLLLRKVLNCGKKALVIEPFVALTREKASTLKSMLYSTKARVGAFGGAYYTPGGMSAVSVAVCTIEKANNFINKLINEDKLSDLGIIVVDEIHYLGDERRGYQLELLLTKVLYYNSTQDENKKIQIIGLSATIPNLESVAVWLNASLYITSYRPVPLVEKIKLGNKIFDVNEIIRDPSSQPIETISPARITLEKDHDDLYYLCIDSISNKHSILVFCESKRDCEIMATSLAEQIKYCGNKLRSNNTTQAEVSKRLRENLSRQKISDVVDKLKKCPAGPDKELIRSLSFGVAFHHAGLTSEEREIIEDGFKGGAIKVIMATSTLSSGVNLPARRVIIRSPMMICSNGPVFKREMLNPITYRQMIGRAGRKNIDTCGESILMCKPEDRDVAIKLIKASLGDINSSLANRMIAEGQPSGLKKAVLEVIANNTANTRIYINQYLKSSFWLFSTSKKEEDEFMHAITETLRYLITKKFIEELRPGVYRATRLGIAVLSSGLHPDESLQLLQDLIKARTAFCLWNDLHIIYQVTPNDIAQAIDLKDWQHYSKIWNELDDDCRVIGERIGIDEIVLARRCQGFMGNIGEDKERIYRRFWVALVINDLISEISLPKICSKYRVSKATVQQAQRAVAQFAGVMSIFCQELGYHNIAALMKPLESRINFSCQRDLLDLIKLNITRPIARALFNADYKTVNSVSKGDKLDIEFIIRQIKPFKKDVSFSDTASEAPYMWVPELAKTMTTLDYASHIVETARITVAVELDEFELTTTFEEWKSREDNQGTAKRRRSDDGQNDEANSSMVRANSDVPNFEIKYIRDDSREIKKFLDSWISKTSISINFKLDDTTNLREESDAGFALSLNIENTKQIVTKLYACFDRDLIVYIVDHKDALKQLRDDLSNFLVSSAPVIEGHAPIKLYTQNIVLTYRILFVAFGIDQATLNKNFEWHSFDVAWWMINDCPTRGRNNSNSSLSLVKNTKWATRYHHFLHSLKWSKDSRTSSNQSLREYMRVKDLFKSGKTAILQPLIDELVNELRLRNQLRAYLCVEIPSRRTMAQMMVHGIGLDMRSMKSELTLYEDLSNRLTSIAQEHYAKSVISLTNIKHVARVLYEDLDLKKYLLNHSTKSNIAKDPTNAEVLEILAEYHPFPKLVQDFRRVAKALEALQAVNTHARYDHDLKMMRVFGKCDFWSVTGRIAMYDPDLFLINRNFTVAIPAHGKRAEEIIECAPRACFVPTPGWIFVAADYSQLELRLLAHFSEETNLLQILNRSPGSNETFDVFRTVASRIYRVSPEEVTTQNRQHAKQICYGIIYGMGTKSLASKLGVDCDKAEEFRQDFFSAFPRIQAYTEELIRDCEDRGFVESLLGRRRPIQGIKSEKSSIKSRANRVAVNTKIQSSASDIIKLAMRTVHQKLLDNFECNARLTLEMHDELIYEVNPVKLELFANTLKFEMENIGSSEGLRVKLLVNLKKGADWSKLETITSTQ